MRNRIRRVGSVILALLAVSALSAKASVNNVDLKDVIAYGSSKEVQFARNLFVFVNKSQDKLNIPQSLNYLNYGLSSLRAVSIYSVSVQGVDLSSDKLKAEIFVIYNSGSAFRLNKANLKGSISKIQFSISDVQSVDLTQAALQAQIDVFNRQITLTEPSTGFLKVYPIGVGSLVNNQIGNAQSGYKSLSPNYKNAIFSKVNSEEYRNTPSYYAGRPFLRIVNLDQADYGGFTPFGAHYQLSSELMRGFISNGCFRVRDNDLYELATMVFSTQLSGVALSIVDEKVMRNQHPYPQVNYWFNTPSIMNDGYGNLSYAKDEHGLFIFNRIDQNPMQLLMK